MAGRQRYLTPPEQMALLAREARLEGLPFEAYWLRAVRPNIRPLIRTNTLPPDRPEKCVIWPSDSQDSMMWCEATLGVKDGWRRAYENLAPAGSEKALSVLGPLLEEMRSGEIEAIAA